MTDGPLIDVPIAAIEHWAYCARQCALIHVEGVWSDNVHTATGMVVHGTVDTAPTRHQPGRRLHHRVPVRSDRHGFYGVCDAVEELPHGVLEPVEHKSGRRATEPAILQVALQAIALEEMTSRTVETGWIWLWGARRRKRVNVGASSLRDKATAVVLEVRRQIAQHALPAPVNDERCPRCSLIHLCLPALR